jgi:pimeloyl-ACP methyl ester carboxylesterase
MGQESRTYRVSGGGGTVLFAEETGNPDGRPVLFLHGLSQCRLAWDRQLRSDLGRDLRLVAVDLRGHGLSEQPRDSYGDSALWAADVHAVITSLELDQPILCGWSYGGVVIGDYLSRHGEAAIGGIALVGAISRLGEPVLPFLGPDFLATVPGLFTTDLEASTAALRTFIRLTTSADPAPEDLYLALGYNVVVPPHVRQAMLSRTLTHDGTLAGLTTPVLVAHGSDDEIILPAMAEHHVRLIPHARTAWYQGIGHSPFLEAPDRFNADLRAFASGL